MLLEQYRYPHLYELRAPGDKYVKLQVLRQLTFRHWIEAEADVCRFLPSYVFTIKEHPRPDANAQWWVVRVQHNGGSGFYLIGFGPDNYGKVYAWRIVDVNLMENPDTVGYAYLGFIADGFAEFLLSVGEFPEEWKNIR